MHLLQSKAWSEVKKALGNKVFFVGNTFIQGTKIPGMEKYIGYVPRVELNSINYPEVISKSLEEDFITLQIDPINSYDSINSFDFVKSKTNLSVKKTEPVQIQGNTILDLTKSEEELLNQMKQKHRYNLNLAKKKGVIVEFSSEDTALQEFLKIHEDTVKRQNYKDRSSEYISTVFNTLKTQFEGSNNKVEIATATFENIKIISWFVVYFEGVVYYLYGGSSDMHRNVMGNYLLVWELILRAKVAGYRKLDFMGISEDVSDGYSRFKVGFGGETIKYSDSINLVLNPTLEALTTLIMKVMGRK